jgi:hypothetical protein
VSTIKRSIEVPVPAETAFAFISDLRNDRKWRKDLKSLQTNAEGPAIVGTEVKERTRFLTQKLVTESKVTVLDPPRELVLTTTSTPEPARAWRRVTPAPEGSLIEYEVELLLDNALKPFSFVIARVVAGQLQENLDQLKTLLEDHPSWHTFVGGSPSPTALPCKHGTPPQPQA